jgi:predicted transcriptional regulator
MSDNKDILIKMLAEEPRLMDLINSKEHLSVLEFLEKDSCDFLNLKSNLMKYIYIKKDIILYNILESLIQKELIKKIKANENQVYFITEKGKRFIELYRETKKEFNI